MNFNRITRNLLQAGIFSFAGVALLTQTASAEDLQTMGTVEDLQGVVACNVAENPWLMVAPLGELPCDLGIGGVLEYPIIEHDIMLLDETTKENILYNRDRQDHPDALVVSPR
ncbi:MAG: hypothetical protein AAGA60_10610 [Cyanobacteria bacterium P01_E01_bin.42]